MGWCWAYDRLVQLLWVTAERLLCAGRDGKIKLLFTEKNCPADPRCDMAGVPNRVTAWQFWVWAPAGVSGSRFAPGASTSAPAWRLSGPTTCLRHLWINAFGNSADFSFANEMGFFCVSGLVKMSCVLSSPGILCIQADCVQAW